MCGICGIINDDREKPVDRAVLTAMNDTMEHRGPDDVGYFLSHNVGLAMRRLSIIDLETGQQPMYSADGTVAAVCNGELYNFREIRDDLAKLGVRFQTKSDAEIIPPLYQEYGDDFVGKLNGMFAFALWDELQRRLVIARDRMGKKPLYWTHRHGVFIFGSELKALLAHPAVNRSIDRAALAKYLAYQYVPAPASIFEGIHKLGPGEMLSLHDGNVSIAKYWDVPMDEIHRVHSEWEVAEELRTLLARSVKRRLISDVPLGVFLSGGIDSSAIVAFMAKMLDPREIKTFSIGFEEKSFDETSHARRVAEHFGTDHHEQLLTASALIGLLPEVSSFLDEPLADNSIVPTYALSKFTRKHVTVALGGDGGDELFAGYPTFQADRYARMYRCIPTFMRKALIEPLGRALPTSDENISFDFKVKQFLKGAGVSHVRRHALWMGAFSPDEQFELFTEAPPSPVFDDVERYWNACRGAAYGNRLLYLYQKLYLQEDILVKVDRASMATSLEVRAPFLDTDVVEFVSRLPYSYKLRGFKMKYLLKKAMHRDLPKGIAGRAKKGFGVPVAKWFKGPLRELLADELSRSKIAREGHFKPAAVERLVEEHLKGKADHRIKLWTLLILELWLKRWGEAV